MNEVATRLEETPLVAGVAVLDLVNTVVWRGNRERRFDRLRADDDCLRWARYAGVITADEENTLRNDAVELLAELVEFRDVVAETVDAWTAPLAPAVVEVIRDAYAHAELVGADGIRRWTVCEVDEHLVRRRLALELAWLLTGDPGRIGACGDEDCRWVFLDTSHGRNRRWCRSADCGNRHRVREHQRRRLAERG